MGDNAAHTVDSVQNSLQLLINIIDADPEIEVCYLILSYHRVADLGVDIVQGILGYSEGATTAASLILEERFRWEASGRPRRIKVRHSRGM